MSPGGTMPISEGESDLVLTKAERGQLLHMQGQLYDAVQGLNDCIGTGRTELWADYKNAKKHLRIISICGATMNAVLYSAVQLQQGLFAVHQAKEAFNDEIHPYEAAEPPEDDEDESPF